MHAYAISISQAIVLFYTQEIELLKKARAVEGKKVITNEQQKLVKKLKITETKKVNNRNNATRENSSKVTIFF